LIQELDTYVESELFEPAEYLAADRPGYYSLAAKPSGRCTQESHELVNLAPVVRGVNPHIDTWISQAAFNERNRRLANLRDVGLLFVDLDTYRIPNLEQRPPEEVCDMLLTFCALEEIPAPSIVMYSGRGLQAKWLLTTPISRAGLMEWNQVQRELAAALEPFGADHNSLDGSRVLRLDRTVNTKSNQVTRVLHVTGGVEAAPARYDFDELREAIPSQNVSDAPARAHALRQRAPSLSQAHHRFTLRRLNWTRLEDIRRLWKLRGGVPVGYREVTLFWETNFLLLAEPGRHVDLWNECQVLRKEIDAGADFAKATDLSTVYRKAKELIAGEKATDLSTVYRKAKELIAGEMVIINGREYPPLYTPRNNTLIDIFRIEPDEERELATIISTTEKVRRRREQRWADGTRPQPYRDTRPWETLGISRRHYYRIREQLEDGDTPNPTR